VLDQLEALGATTTSPGWRCAAPAGCRLKLKWPQCERQREEPGPTAPGLSAAESPWQRCSMKERPACCMLEAFSLVLSPPARGPWGTRRTHRLLLEDQGRARCRLLAIGTRFLCTATSRGEDLANAMSRGRGNSHRPSSACSQGWRQTINKTCGWFTPALLEGAEARLRCHPLGPGQRRICPLWALWCPAQRSGSGVALHRIDPARQEVVLVTPGSRLAA